jgi:hypothetical protein
MQAQEAWLHAATVPPARCAVHIYKVIRFNNPFWDGFETLKLRAVQSTFSSYFQGCPCITIPGFTHPVKVWAGPCGGGGLVGKVWAGTCGVLLCISGWRLGSQSIDSISSIVRHQNKQVHALSRPSPVTRVVHVTV